MSRLALLTLVGLSGCDFVGYGDLDSAEDTGAVASTEFDCADASFFGSQPDFDAAGTLRGRVASPSGTVPVSGAELRVEVDGQTAWTVSAEMGCFSLDLPAGDYALVFEKGRYVATAAATVVEGEVLDLGTLALDPGELKLAVVQGQYDSVEVLITELGIPYDGFVSPADLYDDPDVLAQYDAVFANCGSELTTREGEAYDDAQIANVKAWVEAGGTLYTSDWEHSLFAGVVPDGLDWGDDVLSGPSGVITATIEDRNIQALLGSGSAEIVFDLPDWALAEGSGTANVLVSASIDGRDRPLAVMAFPGEGRAVFTSFHNESQATQDMQVILYELILALSTPTTG